MPQTRLLADAINQLGNNTNAVENDLVEVMNRTRVFAFLLCLVQEQLAKLEVAGE